MSAHWSTIQENTAVFGIRLLYWIYRLSGRAVFFLTLWPIVTAYWILLPRLRRVSLDYFRHLHRFDPQEAPHFNAGRNADFALPLRA